MQFSSQPDAFGLASQSSAEAPALFVADAASKLPSVPANSIAEESIEESPEANHLARPAVDADSDIAEPFSPLEASLSQWKDEVAARVNHYRRRRPRTPRYPSLSLKFDAPKFETDRSDSGVPAETPIILQAALVADSFAYAPARESTGRILEFPRSPYMPPEVRREAIADPVMDLPRILDVPEMMPPPPALGGIHIEADAKLVERRPGFDIPLQSASFSRRLGAGMIDAMLVILSLVGFCAIFFRISHAVLSPREAVIVSNGVGVALWLLYQHLLLGCSGSTVGLRCAKLQLRKFDGRRVPRSTRFSPPPPPCGRWLLCCLPRRSDWDIFGVSSTRTSFAGMTASHVLTWLPKT